MRLLIDNFKQLGETLKQSSQGINRNHSKDNNSGWRNYLPLELGR